MKTNHYKHPKTGDVIGLDEPLPLTMRTVQKTVTEVVLDPETGEEVETEVQRMVDVEEPAPRCHIFHAIEKALADGYEPMSDEQFAQWKIDSAAERYNALPYGVKRAPEYPPITDFADAWVKDDKDALEAYRQKCLAVKAKIPKE